MQSLDLEYRGNRQGSPWAGRALLALAIVVAAQVGISYREARDSVADKERRLARLERAAGRVSGASAAPRAASAEEIAFARDTVRRLATPWDNLFGALEAVPREKVALLAIEPDAKSGSALIVAEAKDHVAALDFVLQLQNASTLKRVHLVRHELRPQGPRGTVGFSVSAAWSDSR